MPKGYKINKMLKKKIITFVLILSFITPFFYLPSQAPRAQAVFGFGDLVIDIKALAERIVDGIAMALAQQIIDRMVASTVKWAQTGFDGNPAYAVNPRQYFTDIADGVAGDFIRGSDLGYLCSPFQASIKLSLVQQYYNPQPFQCTLTDVVGNIEAFYGSFSQGGWDAWFSLTQNETNNPYGAYLKAKMELDSRIASKVGLEKEQLDWNQGFLSWKADCPADKVVTAAQAAEWAGSDIYNHQGLPYKAGDCLDDNLKIATPGSTIKAQLDKVLPSGLDKLITAQHVDQLVSAFATGLLQKFVFGPDGLFSKNSNPDKMQTGGPRDIDSDGIPDGLDTTGDGVPDVCYFGGTTSPAGPPCLGSGEATSTTPPPGTGGSCQAVTESQVMSIVTKYSPSDAGLQQALPELRSAFGSQVLAYGTPGDVRDKLNFGGGMTADVISNAGDPNASWGWILITACGSTGGGGTTPPPGTQPASLLADLQEERAKFPTPMTPSQLGQLLNNVAYKNRAAGWVLLGKASGNNCPSPTGPLVSCDYLVHRGTMYGYDVLIDEGGAATPSWQGPDTSISGQVNTGARTLVDPIAP